MEIWDVYDSFGNPTGRTMRRGDPLLPGDRHLVVTVCVLNAAGEVLIQRRADDKESFAGCWDIGAGGSALAGETSQQAMRRELFEELGIDHDFSSEPPLMRLYSKYSVHDVYRLVTEVDPTTLHLQKEEVSEVRWATPDEIFRLMDEGRFVSYYPSILHYFFDTKGGGTLRPKKKS